MKAWFAKVTGSTGRVGLIPTDEESMELVRKMTDGECAQFSVVRPRSVPWHRMYFGICKVIGENQEPERDADSIDAELRVLAGHYETMYVRSNNRVHEVRVPKRIAFDKMTADEWAEYWRKVEVAIAQRFGETYLANITMDTSGPLESAA